MHDAADEALPGICRHLTPAALRVATSRFDRSWRGCAPFDEGVSDMPSAGVTSFERRRQRLLPRRRFAGRMLKAIGFRTSLFDSERFRSAPRTCPPLCGRL